MSRRVLTVNIKRGIKNGIFYLNGETLDVFDVSERTKLEFFHLQPSNAQMLPFTHFDYLSVTDGVETSKFVNLLWSPHSPPAFHLFME